MKPLDPFTQDTLTAMLAYISDDAKIARHLRIDVEQVRRARAAIPRPHVETEAAPQALAEIEDDRRHERRAAKLSSDALLAALLRASGGRDGEGGAR